VELFDSGRFRQRYPFVWLVSAGALFLIDNGARWQTVRDWRRAVKDVAWPTHLLSWAGLIFLLIGMVSLFWPRKKATGKEEAGQPKSDGTLRALAEEDADHILERLHRTGQRAEFHFDVGSDPYVDIFIDIVNASVFEAVTSSKKIDGRAMYGGKPLASAPLLPDSVFRVKHGEAGTMVIRQFVSEGIADLMWAERSRRVPLDLGTVSISFTMLAPGFAPRRFSWCGPEITMDEAKRL
jgi:hypothetical protein